MLIQCKRLLSGPGPSEAIVSVKTFDGREEEVIVYNGLLNGDMLDVGPILHREKDRVLIELPREAASGQSRIWVSASEMRELQAAE